MKESILNGKIILAVDGEPEVLSVLEEEILGAAPKCKFEKAATYEDAVKKLESQTYDLVILDSMDVLGFDLLDSVAKKNFSAAMLTAYALTPEALKRSIKMKARPTFPRISWERLVPF